jgi:hypothetical protein
MPVKLTQASQINAGIAISNATEEFGTVTLSVTRLDGTLMTTSAPLTMPPAGQIVGFLDSLIPALSGQSLEGVLRITTNLSGISVVGLRSRINARQDFLMATTPATLETGAPDAFDRFFPQVVNGDAFTTEVILFSGTSGQSGSGTVSFFQATGMPMSLDIH